MSLKSLRKIPKTIGFRLTVWYSGIFVLSVFLLFLFTYFYLQATLIRKDHEEIATKLHELQVLYQSGGIGLIERNIQASRKFPEKNKFLIRIADWHNHTLFLYLPYQWIEFDIKRLEVIQPIPKLIRLPSSHHGLFLEVGSQPLMNGFWLQVGKDTRERIQILKKFKDVATIVIFPLLILGILGGTLLAYRALRPVRHLIDSVSSISRDMSTLGQRVPNPRSGDELEELISLFNTMLERIETLIKAMKNSLDNVAHDLRTPITRLRGVAELALQKEVLLQEECQVALGECLEESLEIQKLLDTLMDISEAETGTLKLNLQPVSLDQLIRKVMDLYGLVAEEKGITLEVSVASDLFVMADHTRLGQALANLVDNAVKFTPQGGQVTITALREKGKITIAIRDTGPGIPEKDLQRIWERLYRGDQSRSEKGLGLGLSLVKAIVIRHNGTIEVDSHPGQGSTFTILLPQVEDFKDATGSSITNF
jgi:signal transduction histidine kinase